MVTTMFRRQADRVVDDAHNAICAAEASLLHAFTDADKTRFGDALAEAQRYLARAIAARTAWDACEHDDYEEYPAVPRTSQPGLL
jgi:hypothetical protein